MPDRENCATLKSLSNPGKKDYQTSVLFNGVEVKNPKRCVRDFNKKFIKHPQSESSTRKILPRLRSLPAKEVPRQSTIKNFAQALGYGGSAG